MRYTLRFTLNPGWRSALSWPTEAEAQAEADRRNQEEPVASSGGRYVPVEAPLRRG